MSNRTGLASVAVTSKAKQLATFRVTDYTPDYRETSGVGKRPVLTPDEVLRLPLDEALIIVRGMKPLKVSKYDYSMHPEYSELTNCKASNYVPAWRQQEIETGKSILPEDPPPPSKHKKAAPKSPPTEIQIQNVEEYTTTTKNMLMLDS